jgi:hypothetical protein
MSSATKLRRIHRRELVTGLVLPADLHDRTGRVVIRAGHVLGSAQLEFLAAYVRDGIYVGPDWPLTATEESECAGPTNEEVQEILSQRRWKTDHKVRSHDRHSWSARVTLELEEKSEDGRRQRMVEAVTNNVSVSGFAFLFDQYIHPGTTVRTQFTSLPAKLEITGVVRYCELIAGTRHRIGVEFVEVWRDGTRLDTSPAVEQASDVSD